MPETSAASKYLSEILTDSLIVPDVEVVYDRVSKWKDSGVVSQMYAECLACGYGEENREHAIWAFC